METLKKQKIIDQYIIILFFLFGVFSPMPVIQIRSYTPYVLLISLVVVLIIGNWIQNCIQNKNNWGREKILEIRKMIDKKFILVLVSMFISYGMCIWKMPSSWKSGWATSMILTIMMVIVYCFWVSKDGRSSARAFIHGIYISSVIQMVWGYGQYILYHMCKFDINNAIFRDLLYMVEEASQLQFEKLKVSGLCWNAGNLCPLVLFGFVYSDNKIVKLGFIILSFISGSRTMELGMVMCIGLTALIYCIKLIKRKKIDVRFKQAVKNSKVVCLLKKQKTRNLTIAIIVLIAGIVICGMFMGVYQVFLTLQRKWGDASGVQHMYYYTTIPEIFEKNSILHNLFGFGPGCSGYPLASIFNIYNEGGRWTVESDYVNRLWSYGGIGFIIYYIWYIGNAIKCSKKDWKYIVLFGTFLFQGIFYNVIFNWVELLIIALFITKKRLHSKSTLK